MNTKRKNEFNQEIDLESVKEKIMFDAIREKITKFYEDPKNIQAFEAWKKEKENKNYGTNNFNS